MYISILKLQGYVGLKLGFGVASALFGPSARQGPGVKTTWQTPQSIFSKAPLGVSGRGPCPAWGPYRPLPGGRPCLLKGLCTLEMERERGQPGGTGVRLFAWALGP